MCGGVKFKHDNKDITVYLPNPSAFLPVCLKSGEHSLIKWSRRKEEQGVIHPGAGPGMSRVTVLSPDMATC